MASDSYKITFGGRPIVDVNSAMRTAADHNWPDAHFRGKATSYICPTGSKPGYGFVLMRKSDLDAIRNQPTVDLMVTYRDARSAVQTPLKGMIVTASSMAFPGRENDKDSVYLVTFADGRHAKRRLPWSKAYNLRDRCGTAYLSGSLDAGAAWTWQQLVQDLWAATVGGTAPMLPYTPNGTPEGIDYFLQESALDCLADLLLRINCQLVFDPRTGDYDIRQSDDGRAKLTAFDAARRYVAWNDRAEQWPAADWPETIRVRFRKRPTPFDEADPYYSVDVTATPAPSNVVAGTVLALDDDLYAIGEDSVTNAAELTARATERMQQWVRRRSSVEFPAVRSYMGFVPSAFDLLGYVVGAVALSDRGGDEGAAMTTELAAMPVGGLARWTWNDNPEWLCCEEDYPYPGYGSYDDGDSGATWSSDSTINIGCDVTTGSIIGDVVRYTHVGFVRRGRLTVSTSMEVLEEDKVLVATSCIEVVVPTGTTVECVDGVITYTQETEWIRVIACKACP